MTDRPLARGLYDPGVPRGNCGVGFAPCPPGHERQMIELMEGVEDIPGTALHDGAMIIRGDRIVAASCVLPLSDAQNIDRRLGTRHRAALGLAEETDAWTEREFVEATGRSASAVNRSLNRLLRAEKLRGRGEGGKGDPYRFWAIGGVPVCSPPPPFLRGGEQNPEPEAQP